MAVPLCIRVLINSEFIIKVLSERRLGYRDSSIDGLCYIVTYL